MWLCGGDEPSMSVGRHSLLEERGIYLHAIAPKYLFLCNPDAWRTYAKPVQSCIAFELETG